MPTYEYRCKECGHELEVVQSFSDDSLTECPVCQGELKKVFHPIGISFKGSGFYKTDARAGAKTSSGDSDKTDKGTTSDSKSDKKSETKSDSKSDKKSDSKSDSSSSSGSSSKAEAKSA